MTIKKEKTQQKFSQTIEQYKAVAETLKKPLQQYGKHIALGSAFLSGVPMALVDVLPEISAQSQAIDIDGDGNNDFSVSISGGNIYLTALNAANLADAPHANTFNGGQFEAEKLANGNPIPNGAEGFRPGEYLGIDHGDMDNPWGRPSSGYIGVRFRIGANNHLGWIELSISAAGAFTVVGDGHNPIPIGQAGGNTFNAGQSGLPVELTFFKANILNESASLNWQTASETDNAGFEVERSEDGKNFGSIAWVDGHGTTLAPQEYLFDDKNLRAGKTYYYRLKQVDYNGEFEYSGIVSVTLKGGQSVVGEFYPNPSPSGFATVDFNVETPGEWTATIFDASGKTVKNEQRSFEEGQGQWAFDLHGLAEGIYFVKFENGAERFYRKVVRR